MKAVPFTKEGFLRLKKEIQSLKEKRVAAVDRLTTARGMGDLRENSEYAAAKEELAFMDGRILELEKIMSDAHIIEDQSITEAGIGSRIIVDADGKSEEFVIVGEFEADPMEKRFSHTSPIGQALLGKKVGDVVEVQAPVGKLTYKILEIQKI